MTKTATTQQREVQALAEFRREIRRFLLFSEQAAVAAGLEPQQHQFLLQVAGAPDGALVTISYVAEALSLRHHTVVELSKRCERAGLVKRAHDAEDRRRVVLALTPKGNRALQQLSAIHAQQLRELASGLIPALIHIRDSKSAGAGAKTSTSRTEKRSS